MKMLLSVVFLAYEPCSSGFVFTTFVMYITTTMCDGVLHCLVFDVFLLSLRGD